MKLTLLGDLHLNSTPPSPYRTSSYCDDILAKLQAAIDISSSFDDLDGIISLGDFFHTPNPQKTPHWLVNEALDILSTSIYPFFIVTGNHDVVMRDLSRLDNQPLGVILRAENVHSLHGRPTAEFEGFDVVGLPYVDNLDDWNQFLEGAHIGPDTLVCAHASIFPVGEMPLFEAISAEDMSALIPDMRYCAYGHIHNIPKKGAYYRAGTAWFCNRGALSRGSLHAENLTRVPGITLFDSSNPDEPFTSIDLPHKPASEVFLLDQKELEVASNARVEGFLESLEEVEAQWITKSGIQEQVLKELGVGNHHLVEQIFDAVD